jgi:hypothetical protein
MEAITFTGILEFASLALSSAIVILDFSLLTYILAQNLQSRVAQAFAEMMAFVALIYLVDVTIVSAETYEAAHIWLQVQWLGIAFVPAVSYQFSDAVLRTTGTRSRYRRALTAVAYLMAVATFAAVVFTPWLVAGIGQKGRFWHFVAGPLFWVFATYYLLINLAAWLNVRRAQLQSLTSSARRRMSYLALTILAPSIAAFPYLLVPTAAQALSINVILMLTLMANAAIAAMTLVIGYTVAYQGMFVPDRVIKHRLIHFLLRGPLVAIMVLILMLLVPSVESILGLPRDTVMVALVAGTVVLLQILVNKAKPIIDRLAHPHDHRELALIEALDERLLTTTDLEQLLENTLITLCERMRAPAGFIVAIRSSELVLRIFCGAQQAASDLLSGISLAGLIDEVSKSRVDGQLRNEDWIAADGHWLLPLRAGPDRAVLGIVGVRAVAAEPVFEPDELLAAQRLVERLDRALEDIELQRQVLAIVQGLESELVQLQEWRSQPSFASSRARQGLATNPIHSAGFAQTVKEALGQLWGGPKLTHSPLMRLQVVRDRLAENDHVPAKAARSVLTDAIERLRPEGERSLTAAEWLLYNILELRYVQGHKIRDIARRLAMSESDYYRKQRIAIEQVAEMLIQMERSVPAPDDGSDPVAT